MGFMNFAKFMQESGLIKKVPDSAASYFFDNEFTRGGS
jgi:hypothetical protein